MNGPTPLSVQTKLTLGLATVIGVLVALVILAFAGLTTLAQSERDLFEQNFGNAYDLANLRANVNAERLDAFVMIEMPPEAWGPWRADLDQRSIANRAILQRLAQRFKNDSPARAKLRELVATREAFTATRENDVLPRLRAQQITEAKEIMLGIQMTRHKKILALADELEAGETMEAATMADASANTAKTLMTVFALAGGAAVLGALGLSALLRRTVTNYIALRERSEAALRESEERFRSLVETSMDAVLLTTPDGKILSANAAACQIFGRTEEELIRLGREGVVDSSDPRLQVTIEERARNGQAHTELTLVRHGGIKFPAEVSSAIFKNNAGQLRTSMVIRDLTDRLQSEAALRLQSAALTAAANAIVITQRDGSIVWVNDAFTTLTGYSHAEAVGRNPRELVKSGRQDEAFYEELWSTIIAGRVWHGELVNRRKDGTLYPEEQTITPVHDASGVITHFIAIKQDLTEKKAVDEMVQASRRQFQAVFEQAAVGIIIASGPRGDLVNVNRRFCEMTGYTPEELRALSSCDITHPDDVAGDTAELEKITAGTIPSFSREKRYRRKDGTFFWARTFVAPLDPSEPKPTLRIGVIEDITARKTAEDVLRASEARFIRQRDALITLTSAEADADRNLELVLRRITETSARVLGAARVSLWRYTADRSAIHCIDLYELAADRHTSGLELDAVAYPAYFRALEQMDVIAVEEPEHDPRTCEFADSYLRPLGITSMLDAGIHVHGVVGGVLCHEQTGPPRAWKPDEQTFAAALANLASLAIVEAQRRAAEEALRGTEQKLRTIVEHSTQLFYSHTPDNVLTYVSPQAREMFDCEPAEAMRRWTEFLTDHPENAMGIALTQAAVETGCQQRPYQLELRTPRGRTLWVEVRESPVVVDGRTVAIAGALTDITDRKLADEALRESDRFNRGTLDALGAHIAVLDADGRIVATNQAWRAFAAANAAQWPTVSEGSDYLAVCRRAAAAGSDDAAQTIAGFQAVAAGSRSIWFHEYPCHSPTEERWFYCRITQFPGEGPVRLVVAHEDITALKRAQSAQRQSEERFRQFFGNTPDIIYSLDPTGVLTALNEAFETVTGWPRAEWLGRPFLDILHPDDRPRTLARFQTVLRGERPEPSVELRLRTAGGAYRDIEVTGFSSPLSDGRMELQGIVRDITERKRAQERLQREQELFDHLASTIPDLIYFKDRQSRFVRINDALARHFGLRLPAEAEGKSDRDFFDLSHAEAAFADEQRIMATGQPLVGREEMETWPDGRISWVSTTKMPMRDASERITGLVGISRDITERKAAERLLHEQAEIIAHAHEGVMIVNLANQVTLWNRGAEEIFGVPAADALGQPPERVLGVDELGVVSTLRAAVERDGHWSGELKCRHREGRQVVIECRTTLVRDSAGRPRARLNFFTDVTEKKLLEEKFLHAQRLESIGMLAAGIAHDLNNVLAPIVFAAPMLRASLSSERDLKILSSLERSADRGAGLVKQILGFAHTSTGALQVTQVKHLARDIAEVIESTFPWDPLESTCRHASLSIL